MISPLTQALTCVSRVHVVASADVQLGDGSMVLAHAPSLDCAGMVALGATVYMSKTPEGSTAKTAYAIQVSAHSHLPNCYHMFVVARTRPWRQAAAGAP
eukprot:364588-Chlamydomonas_euryale.AAC.20